MTSHADIESGSVASERGVSSRSLGSVRSSMRLGSLIYDRLKERLLEGAYAAGERLSVEALRTEFDVSKQPVMDALRRLASERLVEIIPQVGIQVSTYSRREIQDFFRLFAGVEGTIAEIAALRRTEAQLVELTRVDARVTSLSGEKDPAERARRYRVLNRQFHSVIHAMAGSEIMVDVAQRMFDLSDFLINTSGIPAPLTNALDERHSDHEAILEALLGRDASGARRQMEEHILETVAGMGDTESDADAPPN